MPKNKPVPCRDHKGRDFPSLSEMADAYGLPASTVRNRLARGWTLEQTLEIKNRSPNKRIRSSKPVRDHTGREFPSIPAMARHWGITDKIYWSRKRLLGWPIEKILTTPVQTQAKNSKSVADHTGREFPSISAMCRHWNIKLSTYRERRRRGWDLEQALTGEELLKSRIQAETCQDHDGNEYPSKAEMCRAYGITRYCYQSRLDLGWSQEKALTEPMVVNAEACRDYKNREFPSLKDMANFLGLPPYAFHARRHGPEMIEKLIQAYWQDRDCGDIKVLKCVEFPWFLARSNSGAELVLHFEAILDIYHDTDFDPLPETRIPRPRLEIVRKIRHPWYLIRFDGEQAVMRYEDLVRLNTDINFGLSKQGR